MIYTLVFRCFPICSKWVNFHNELVFLKDIFFKNEYPISFIDKCLKQLDYAIPGYSLHPVNLDSNIGRRIIYNHSSIDNCVIQNNSDIKLRDVCWLEIRLNVEVIIYSLIAFTEVRLLPAHQKDNAKLNNLLKYLSGNKYSHQFFVGDFNFRNINWFMWTTPHNEESKETEFSETIRDWYLYQHLLEQKSKD